MTNSQANTIWQRTLSEGATESERYLSKLARKAFLSFWSYSNPYTDEGGGKELCDFLVVFGNDIIIFSDKHCEFSTTKDHDISWRRWYKSAIYKSSRQLSGASSFIERYPERIYLDPGCKHPLPIPLPSASKRKIHLVAVTRGSAEASKKYWGNGSSSSLVINTTINERQHETYPFMVGWPLKNRQFVHVFDELTLDVLLDELDTAPDFIEYLTKKEELLSAKDRDFIIPGEEDLYANYLAHRLDNHQGYSFSTIPKDEKLISFEEGMWRKISSSNAYRLWKSSRKTSYEWDNLIEHQTAHINNKTAEVLKCDDIHLKDVQAHEVVLRAMAEERREVRQLLAEAHNHVLTKEYTTDRLTRMIVIPNRPSRAYIFMALKMPEGHNYETYRLERRASLMGYCRAARFRAKGITEVIGIASEQKSCEILTQDFAFMKFDEKLTCKEIEQEISYLRAAGIWKDHWSTSNV